MTLLELEQALDARQEEMGGYLTEIRSYPRLTPQQERELAMACAAGDEEAIRRMVCSNLRLVVSIAREYAGRGVPLLDLIQEGSIGLLVATRKFDYTLDFRFSTYATKWIRQGITRCLMNHAGLIRVPVHTAQQIQKLLRQEKEMTVLLGRAPSLEELAKETELPVERVQELKSLLPEVGSLDTPVGEDEDGSLLDLMEDLQTPQPYQELVRRELKNTLEEMLSGLNERQQRILRLHYGLEDGICHSLENIGKLLGISKERARQIEHQAMDKLREAGADLGLEDFL